MPKPPSPSRRATADEVARLAQVSRVAVSRAFNPDAPQQVLGYLAQQGIAAPVDKKRKKPTTAKKAITDLAKQHRDDPFFQLQLDWKAVQKVDAAGHDDHREARETLAEATDRAG